MDEQTLQELSKALTHLVFRNGIVENLHASCAKFLDVIREWKVGNAADVAVLPAFLLFGVKGVEFDSFKIRKLEYRLNTKANKSSCAGVVFAIKLKQNICLQCR